MQGHTKRRRDEEREAGMAVKSAKKARRIGRATAAAQHQQAAADSEETLEHAADAHAAATGSPGPGPDADVQQLSTPGAGLAGVPSPSSPAQAVAAAGRHDAAGAHPGGDELDGDDADRLPDSVVQELLRRQRWANSSLPPRAISPALPGVAHGLQTWHRKGYRPRLTGKPEHRSGFS